MIKKIIFILFCFTISSCSSLNENNNKDLNTISSEEKIQLKKEEKEIFKNEFENSIDERRNDSIINIDKELHKNIIIKKDN